MTNNTIIVEDDNSERPSRLPVDIVPHHYRLELNTDLKEFKFAGNVEIELTAKHNVSEIVLNAIDLEINDGYVDNVDGSRIPLKKIIQNKSYETVVLRFEKDNFLPKVLSLKFNGTLSDGMKGFYRSSFTIGEEKVDIATTQFEACDARRAFPCFDEPAVKATFDVTLIYDPDSITLNDKNYPRVALSNGDLISETKTNDGKIVAKFETSPLMSTYLLAFIIGPFGYVEDKTTNNCRVRVYTRPGKEEQGLFGLDVACKSLEFYENYFDIKFPLNKMDLIGIPDFLSGAMENWGLVTYRESCLLFDPKLTSTSAKQNIAIVVTHELAHQWFGNLVTMAWWDNLWLNEGFASFMEYLCADKIFPEWDLWSQYLADVWVTSMGKDSLNNSHPIEVPVNHASEINEIFDDISYSKGSAIIRMLYNYIGDDMFRAGMKDYLEKFAYKNAVTNDLWDCLGKASGKPITQMMSAWTNQMGYPWIKVETVEGSENSEDMTVTLKQEKFTVNGKLQTGDEKMRWMIPISIMSGSNHVDSWSEFMDTPSKTITIPKQGNNWLKLNVNTVGFYRTAYPTILLDRLTNVIQDDLFDKLLDDSGNERLAQVDRLGIQNDYFALCRAGHVETSDLLKLLSAYQHETDYTVWKSIDISMLWLSIIFREPPYNEPFLAFGKNLYDKIYNKLSWRPRDGEPHTDGMLRALIINRLVALGHEDVINICQKQFHRQIDQGKPIPADMRGAVYNSISKFGTDLEFDQLFKIYKEADSAEQKNQCLRALAQTKDQNRQSRVVKLVFSEEVRNQDKIYGIIPAAISNPKFAWNVFKENHAFLKKIYGPNHMMSATVSHVTQYFTSEDSVKEIDQFFVQNKFPGTERAVQQSIETIRSSAEWLARIAHDSQTLKFLGKYLHK